MSATADDDIAYLRLDEVPGHGPARRTRDGQARQDRMTDGVAEQTHTPQQQKISRQRCGDGTQHTGKHNPPVIVP